MEDTDQAKGLPEDSLIPSSVDERLEVPLTSAAPNKLGLKFPFSRALTLKLLLTGIVLPSLCIVAACSDANASIDEPWQSGELRHYVTLLLKLPPLGLFLPLIAYSMLSLCVALYWPTKRTKFWVFVGLVTGTILSLQFLACVIITSHLITLVCAVFAIAGMAIIGFSIEQIRTKYRRFSIFNLMIFTAVIGVILALIQLSGSRPMQLVITPLIVLFCATPTLNFITYCRVTFAAISERRQQTYVRGKLDVPLIFGWVVPYFFAWKLAVEMTILEYQNLPMSDPNCYVSSAAANGHPQWVGAEKIETPNGLVTINRQMQRLKFLEFVLLSVFPMAHSPIRNAYNRFGPRLASLCQRSTVTADMTYALLKPVEWLSELLRYMLDVSADQVGKIYR